MKLLFNLTIGLLTFAAAAQGQNEVPERWEKAITAFEAKDQENPPEKGQVLFVGSSTIVGWNLEKFFPDLKALNRGFGGSTVRDVLHYFEQIVTPYQPRTIVFYSGDNDIAGDATPEEVIKDYKEFLRRVREALPETRVILLGIKPSVKRWALWDKMQQVNAALKSIAEQDAQVVFVDTAPPLLSEDGKPRAELLKEDGLHLNDAGYATWTPLVVAALDAPKKPIT